MITASAILKDGKIYIGKRHSDIFRETLPLGCLKGDDVEQGFVTDEGEFLDRVEALKYAKENGQAKNLEYRQYKLYSENLW